jgi:hypothetical protein
VRANSTLLRTGELRYGLIVAVDIEDFSKLGVLEQAEAQILLAQVLEQAAAAAGLARDDWYIQARGDGELAVLPAHTDVAWVIAEYTQLLDHALGQLRSDPVAQPKLRLRLAMHHGAVTAGRLGPIGKALIVACRLLDARPTKQALVKDTSADLVLVISQQLYDDVVETRFHGLATERFRLMRARIKGRIYRGYLCLGSPTIVPSPLSVENDRFPVIQ